MITCKPTPEICSVIETFSHWIVKCHRDQLSGSTTVTLSKHVPDMIKSLGIMTAAEIAVLVAHTYSTVLSLTHPYRRVSLSCSIRSST